MDYELRFFRKLWTPEVYAKVHKAAMENRIQTFLFDIGSENSWKLLVKTLSNHSKRLDLVDLSNAWWSLYSREKSVYNIVSYLSTNASHLLYIVLTDPNRDRNALISEPDFETWDYLILPINSSTKVKILKQPRAIPNLLSKFGSPETFNSYMHGSEDRDPTSTAGGDQFVKKITQNGKWLGNHLYLWEGELENRQTEH